MRSHKYPPKFNHNIVQACSAEKIKPNQFPIDVCFLPVMFLLEFTSICSKAPRSRCNGCLRRCKPQYIWLIRGGFYLWLDVNTVSLPGAGALCRVSARAGWRGRRTARRTDEIFFHLQSCQGNSTLLGCCSHDLPL